MKSIAAKAFLAGIAISAACLGACSSQTDQGPGSVPGATQDNTGSIGLKLDIGQGVTISKVNWVISNPALLPADLHGSVDVSNSQSISFVEGGLPAGTGYTITLSAVTDGPNPLSCLGTTTFSIIAGATSPANVTLVCSSVTQPDAGTGSVSVVVTPVIQPSCAAVTALSASPSSVNVGGAVALAAAGIDGSGSSSDVTLQWSVTGGGGSGTFSSATGAATSFICTGAGGVTVTVTAVLPGGASCTGNTSSVALTCTAVGDAGVVVDSGKDSSSPADTGPADTGPADTGPADTGPKDSGPADTGPADTGPADTGPADTGPADTGPADTGPADTGPADTGPADTGPADTGPADTGPADTGPVDSGPPPACDPSNPKATTQTCFASRDKSTSSPDLKCSACVVANSCFDPVFQGGTCELVTGNANLLSTALPDGKTCSAVIAPLTVPVTETSMCLGILNTVFTSACAASLQETPCLCGTTDVTMCLAGSATPTGAAYDQYACDFGSANGSQINSQFLNAAFGAGEANQLVQCAAAFGCDCF